ncbi:MAG: molybdenum cofactor guanylyltransferase [Acidimicrobiales bacterium]
MAASVSGAVLTGGASRRMGTDKAVLAVGGRGLARRVADVLEAAGASPVVAVGGDAAVMATLGLAVVDEPFPGAGPLSGVAGALRSAPGPVVVVAACDLPALTVEAVQRLVQARTEVDADVAVALVDGVRQVQLACWTRRSLEAVEQALAVGRRSIQAVLDDLDVCVVADMPAGQLIDLDTPADVDRYASGP